MKLGWGTAYVTRNLRDKLALYASAGVPVVLGGHLLGGLLRPAEARRLAPLGRRPGPPPRRGLGRHDQHPARRPSWSTSPACRRTSWCSARSARRTSQTVIAPYRWVELIEAELRAGAWKVITEARETGTAGIFRGDGEVRMGLIDEIVHAVDPNRLLFEAPQKAQQVWFIRKFGPNVNLGNIPPDEVIPLETLRLGLRADTLHRPDPARPRGRSRHLSAATPGPIAPHGGTLVERSTTSLDEGGERPRVTLSARQQADLDLIAVGAMSPLDGFMGRGGLRVGGRATCACRTGWPGPCRSRSPCSPTSWPASAPPTRWSWWTRTAASSACSR